MEDVAFKTTSLKIRVSDKIGDISAEIIEPESSIAMITLAHGAGTDMHHVFLCKLAVDLARLHVSTIRFNFPYKEQNRKMPDRYPVAAATIRAVIKTADTHFPGLPLFCSGKSFGGRMTSQTLADQEHVSVKGIIFFGFPLHPADNPSVVRAEHLNKITLPMLFLQGTKDMLAYMELLEGVCKQLKTATLITIEGADHSFNKGRQSVIAPLAQQSTHWIKSILPA